MQLVLYCLLKQLPASRSFGQRAFQSGGIRELPGTNDRGLSTGCIRLIANAAGVTSGSATGSLLRVCNRSSGRHVSGPWARAVGLNGRRLILRSVEQLLIFDDASRGPLGRGCRRRRQGRTAEPRRDRSRGRVRGYSTWVTVIRCWTRFHPGFVQTLHRTSACPRG